MLDDASTLSDALRATATASPNKIAIVDEQGELTYGDFDNQVDAFASFLGALGVGRGDAVAYLFWNQRELLIAYHGITRIDAVSVSLNYRLTGAELAYQLELSKARVIAYDESFIDVVDEALRLCPHPIRRIQAGRSVPPDATFTFSRALQETVSHSLLEHQRPTAHSVSGIWFTSGTEGRPKGAAVRHRSALAAAIASSIVIGIQRDCRCLAVAPLFHRGAAENIALAVTMVGGTHYLQSRFSPSATLAALKACDITLAFIVPTMARMLIQELQGEHCELPALDNWVSASAPMPPALETQIRQRFKPGGIVSFYGITEMVCVSARRTTTDGAYDGSVGYPAPNVQVMIYDDMRGPLPCGEIGEIFIRGPVAFSYYVGNPEATARATARIDGVEWYRSGDIGMLDGEGCLSILDRRKDMILSGGENIYSAEVENAILLHPGVAEVAVVGRPEEKWGEIVVAFVVARDSEDLSLESIRMACQGLASYKHPKELFVVESLPRNSFGKVQKAILKQGFPAQPD